MSSEGSICGRAGRRRRRIIFLLGASEGLDGSVDWIRVVVSFVVVSDVDAVGGVGEGDFDVVVAVIVAGTAP